MNSSCILYKLSNYLKKKDQKEMEKRSDKKEKKKININVTYLFLPI